MRYAAMLWDWWSKDLITVSIEKQKKHAFITIVASMIDI